MRADPRVPHSAPRRVVGRTLALPEPAGSEGFVAYSAVPLVAKGLIKGVLEVFHRSALELDPEWLEFLEALAGQAAIVVDNATLFEGLRRSNLELTLAYDATIEGWSRAMDLRDHETEGHSRRVTEMTLRLARALEIGEAELVHVRRGALLHDIGKMGIPDPILLKPGPLTDDEWVGHAPPPDLRLELLSPISFLRPALEIPYCHHEKWDGSGYPRGLKGEQIPLAARIFAAVDIWDASALRPPVPQGLARRARAASTSPRWRARTSTRTWSRRFCSTSTRRSLSGRHPPRSRSPRLPSRPMTIKAGTDLANRLRRGGNHPPIDRDQAPEPGEFGGR